MEECKIKNLYNLDETIASKIFEGATYPWEVLPKIEEFIKELGNTLSSEEYEKRGEDIWIAKTATIAPTAYIKGPAIIGKNAEIRHCAFIRGKAIVGEGAVVGNSTELKNVILFNKVQVPHYNYVGDSILGYKAHMGAGSITSNVKSDKKLVVAGGASHTNDYLERIKEKARQNKNIIITGFVQGEELEELYSNCYIYCLPSDIEGMPISLLEAMSYGKNCLISAHECLFRHCADRAHPVVRQFFKAEVRVAVHIAAHGADKAFTAALIKRAFRRHIGRRADRRQTVHFTAVEIIRHRRANGAVAARYDLGGEDHLLPYVHAGDDLA